MTMSVVAFLSFELERRKSFITPKPQTSLPPLWCFCMGAYAASFTAAIPPSHHIITSHGEYRSRPPKASVSEK